MKVLSSILLLLSFNFLDARCVMIIVRCIRPWLLKRLLTPTHVANFTYSAKVICLHNNMQDVNLFIFFSFFMELDGKVDVSINFLLVYEKR